MKNKGKKLLGAVLLMFCTAAAVWAWYVNDYYRSEPIIAEYLKGTEQVKVKELDQKKGREGLLFDGPGEEIAIIFYPGAKVEYTAYAPIFMGLAEEGIDCFLLKMPGNLAILGADKAAQVMEAYDYSQWYLSGHSLGGAMAADFAASHKDDLSGLVLLAAYPTKEIESKDMKVLSVYGSQDRVLNQEKLVAGRQLMPENYEEICIEGGNHAQFGAYGVQEGDGQATIAAAEQWEQTVNAILEIIN